MAAEWTAVPGGFNAANGFLSAGVDARLRYRERPDLAIGYCEERAAAAAVFTQNRFASPTIAYNKEQLAASGGYAQAVVVNAGQANAATGERGLNDARAMGLRAAETLGVHRAETLVASTGVIGQFVPMEKALSGIDAAAAEIQRGGNELFSAAILTTDLVEKTYAAEAELDGQTARIGGCCKGSGMIAPNMATMLAFVSTDIRAEPGFLAQALRRAAAKTFNRITVDGDCSTNDLVILMASGRSAAVESHTETAAAFERGLEQVCRELAMRIARDGEGATALIEVTVRGAASGQDAEKAARAVAESALVKTAVYGKDANWGRIVCALGYSGAQFDPQNASLRIGETVLVENGAPIEYSEEEAAARLSEDPVRIIADLGAGDAEATFWTCDLTHGYIDENASYRS